MRQRDVPQREEAAMSTTAGTGPQSLADGVHALRAKWGWIVALGVISLIAGVVALGSVVWATGWAVLVIGVMMVMEGVSEIVAAFNVKEWGRFVLWGLLGLLYIAAGVICFWRPFEAATILTLFLGAALVVGGIVRMVLAWNMREAGKPWGWVVVSGIISVLLGLIIVAKWPYSSFYTLGIFLGVDLIMIGSGWMGVGLALKRQPA
jgi:uncharacterized membrane protein HdeD (DUF308 family)